MLRRSSAVIGIAAFVLTATAAIANAKGAPVVFCDNGVAPSVVASVHKNGTVKLTTGDAMLGVVGQTVIVDLGHDSTTQIFVDDKSGQTEYPFAGNPQSVVNVPFVGSNAWVSVCIP